MANVLNRTTKQYLESVNTPDYPTQDWIINPDLSAVTGYAPKYWIITGNVVTLMDQTSRDAVDAADTSAAKDKLADNIDQVLIAFVKCLNDGTFVPNSSYTAQQIRDMVRSKM